MSDSDEISAAISDMKFELGAESDRDLAEKLGIDPTAVSAWRRRKKIPDKYRVRFSRIKDEIPLEDAVAPPSFYRLQGAYAFSLIREAARQLDEKVVLFRDEPFVDLWTGFRLHRLYEHSLREFRRCPPGDKDSLRRVYQELRERIGADDIYEWIETLPEPL